MCNKELPKLLYGENYRKEEIDCIINNFDFKKIHKVMKFLNLTWRGEGVPSIEELKNCARKLLLESALNVHQKEYVMGTVGFVVRKLDNDFLALSFELDYVDSTWYSDFK